MTVHRSESDYISIKSSKVSNTLKIIQNKEARERNISEKFVIDNSSYHFIIDFLEGWYFSCICLVISSLNFVFILFEGWNNIIHLPVPSPSAYNSCTCRHGPQLKPRTWFSIWVSHVCCLSGYTLARN